MIISDLYKTIITSNDTRINILNNREIEIIIKLMDYNNVLVKNKNVLVTCKNGVFTSYNNTNTNTYTTITSTNSKTFNTGATGILKIKFKADNSTIGYSVISANNTNLLIENYRDTGWVDVTFKNGFRNYYYYPLSNSDVNYFNEYKPVRFRCYNRVVEIRGIFTNIGTTDYTMDSSASTERPFASIPSAYAPSSDIMQLQQGSNGERFYVLVTTNGELKFAKNTDTQYKTVPHSSYNDTLGYDVGNWLHCNVIYLSNI